MTELGQDRDFFYALSRGEGPALESPGTTATARPELREAARRVELDGLPRSVTVLGETWRLLAESVSPKVDASQATGANDAAGADGALADSSPSATLVIATNIEPTLRELARMRRYLLLGAVLLVALTGLGTGLIVSATTANLRAFAASLGHVRPSAPDWTPPRPAASAEEKQLFSSFQGLMAAIRQAGDAQRLFIAGASHELKTPVAAMLTALDVALMRRRTVEEYEATCRGVLDTARGLKRLTTTLLALARTDELKQVEKSPVAAQAVLGTLAATWQPRALERGVRLEIAPAPPGLELATNVTLLEVALGNLVDNAIKYGRPAGAVLVAVARDHRGCVFTVRDDGIGMREADVRRLGEVFFRANEARPDDTSFGLGFAQTAKIATLIGGRLDVSSTLGRGTEVRLTLT
jgi:signal transduction histidine kinase